MEKELLVNNEFTVLINGCINGDHNCQSILYKKYYNIIFTTCLRKLKNRPESEDLTQDIFLKIINKLDKFSGHSFTQLSVWISRLSSNHTIDFIRARKKTESIDNIPKDLLSEVIDVTTIDNSEQIMAKDVKIAISNLPKQYKAVFELYYISNYSHQEIADQLNLNVGTSKSNLFKAKRKLASALSQYNNRFN